MATQIELVKQIYANIEADNAKKAVQGCLRLAKKRGVIVDTLSFLKELYPETEQFEKAFMKEIPKLKVEAALSLIGTVNREWAAERRMRVSLDSEAPDGDILRYSVGELQKKLDNILGQIKDLEIPPSTSEFGTAIANLNNSKLIAAYRAEIDGINEIKERILTKCFNYASKVEKELEKEPKEVKMPENNQKKNEDISTQVALLETKQVHLESKLEKATIQLDTAKDNITDLEKAKDRIYFVGGIITLVATVFGVMWYTEIGAIHTKATKSGEIIDNIQTAGTNQIGLVDMHIKNGIPSLVPIGAIVPYYGEKSQIEKITPPTKAATWLLCDGRIVDKKLYPDLYNRISEMWPKPTGKQKVTIRIPDLGGMFLRGANGKNEWIDRDKRNGGSALEKIGSTQNHALESHTHQVKATFFKRNLSDEIPATIMGTSFGEQKDEHTCSRGGNTTEPKTGTVSTETRPNNMYINYIIRAK